MALRFEAAEHDRTERELSHLEQLRSQAMGRIRQLGAKRQGHAAQRALLMEDAERSQHSIDTLDAAEARD